MAATTTVSPGAQTSEFTLAKFGMWAGFAMIAGSVGLDLFHPMGSLGSDLRKYGFLLMGTAGSGYATLRTVLKVAATAKSYEPQAEAVAAFLPGSAGAEARHFLPVIEKLVDKLAAIQAAPAAPPATQALAAAVAAPVAPAGSPVAPGAA